MDTEKINAIRRMIEKECQRNSLVDLCEYYEVTCEEFYKFLDYAWQYFELQK